MTAIPTPFRFEPEFTPEEFQKIGQFAARWALIEHIVGNCARRVLDLDPKQATVLVFPLSLDARVEMIRRSTRQRPLADDQRAYFDELLPLVRAIQYIRNTTLHGVVIKFQQDDEAFFHLRSRDRKITKTELFACEDLINYTAHVVQAFRISLGEKDHDLWPPINYTLPGRPTIPSILPDECRSFKVGALPPLRTK